MTHIRYYVMFAICIVPFSDSSVFYSQLSLPVDLPLFTGSYADLVIITLHKLIVNGMSKLSSLYNCFLTIICNISAYCKSLTGVASVKLVNLLQLFTSPQFLYAAEGNHVYVGMLLESFNNIVQYQYEGNANLVYSIVRRKEVFEKLMSLTLTTAIKCAVDATTNSTVTSEHVISQIEGDKSGYVQKQFNAKQVTTSSATVCIFRSI